jgi:hypothetical protein
VGHSDFLIVFLANQTDFMKHFSRPFSLLLFLVFFTSTALLGQQKTTTYQLKLRTGSVQPEVNTHLKESHQFAPEEVHQGHYFRLIQFYNVPSSEEKVALNEAGIRLLDYLPNRAYLAAISTAVNWGGVDKQNLRSILLLDERIKLHPNLFHHQYPEWAMFSKDDILLNLVLFDQFELTGLLNELKRMDLDVVETHRATHKVTIKTAVTSINTLAKLPYVSFIEPIDKPAQAENYTGRTLHRSNTIASDFPGGLHYDGTGINVGMHDDGIIGPHIDYEGRVPVQYTTGNGGDHGDHVAGTIMGAGNLNPLHRGMAFGADLYVYSSSNNNYDSVPSHYANLDVVITSKSYSNGCNAGYTSLSRELDRYVRQNPSLMHVFSAGNDGTSDCGYGAGAGWGNITGGHKAGKNVIAVANLNNLDVLATSSSRGPAEDGRIKPDVSAKGTAVISTTDANDYVSKTGTSMSCPGVSGSLTQLYHAYRDMNAGSYPSSALMKGIMMNTADDIGNPGPDFRYGWGRINNLKALEVLQTTQYFFADIDQNDSNTHSITVPAGVKQLKVMVYWNDYEASSAAATALVNNLDMRLEDPSSTSYLPWVLDPTPNPTALNANAVRGTDDLNNVEQVTLDNPAAGSYSVVVKGKLVPQGPQEYAIVYSFLRDEVRVTHPDGGESFVPGEIEIIRWDAPETIANFTIEYSTNNGGSWNLIAGVSGTRRYHSWLVPNGVSGGETRIRVSNAGNSDVSDTSFSILSVPNNLQVEWVCPDSLKLSWDGVSDANEYELSQLGVKYMDSIGRSSITSHVVHGVQPNEGKWFSVKALGANNATGRRAIAIRQPNGTFNCPIENDLAVTEVVRPTNSVPDCSENGMLEVRILLKNEGTNAVLSIPVNYQINNGIVVTEVASGPIAAGGAMEYAFSAPFDFSSLGNYRILAWPSLLADGNFYNDTVEAIIASYTSPIVTLPYHEDFEGFALCDVSNDCGGTTCNLNNGWLNHENGTIDDMDWRTDRGGTRTDDTGPDVDHNPGTNTGKYVYTEVSGSCVMQRAEMVSPCIDLSGTVEPELTFWYHMNGTDMGTLSVDVLQNQEWINELAVHSGSNGNEWTSSTVNLTAFAGDTITIRFRGVSASGPFGDMAIDDISIVETYTGVEETVGNRQFVVHPNPTSGKISITNLPVDEEMQLQLTDVHGKVLLEKVLPADTETESLDISVLSVGVYVIQLQSKTQVWSQKVVMQ